MRRPMVGSGPRHDIALQVAGGGPGWQVAGGGRDAMTSHPFEAEGGSRRALAKVEDSQRPSTNGRDGDHVPTKTKNPDEVGVF